MQWLFSEEHIFLETEDIKKVAKLLEKELGITNIRAINATVDSFEIVRLCINEEDSLASNIRDVKETLSIQRLKEFAKNHNKKE